MSLMKNKRQKNERLIRGKIYTTFIMADRLGGMVTTNIRVRPERPLNKASYGV